MSNDKTPSPSINFPKLYGFFLSTLGRNRKKYFLTYFFSLLHPISAPFAAVFTSLAVSFLAAGNFHDLTPLWMYIGGIALMDGLSIFVLRTYLPPLHEHYQQSYNNTIHKVLYHIKTLGLDWYAGMNGGDIIHRVTRGAEALKKTLSSTVDILVHESLRSGITVLFAIYFLHDINFLLGILLYVALSFIIIHRFQEHIYKRYNHYKEIEKEAFTNIFNFTSGFSTIKLANLSDFFLNRTDQDLAGAPDVRRKLENIVALRQMLLRTLQYALYLGLFVYVGYAIVQGKTKVGTLVLVFSLLQNLGVWLQNYATVENTYLENKTYFESLFEIFNVKPGLQDRPDAQNIDKNWISLRFDRVSFQYQSKQNFKAIDNLDLEIKRGGKIAFVGESGSGKSTLAKLLLRQYRIDGNIFIGEQNLFDLKADSIYGTISYLPQDVEIFDLTFKENITLGLPEAKGAFSLKEIVRIAHLDDILNRLPEGMDTLVGARGIKLSGGERQRLGIARALYQEREVYVFDECTSQLDGITEDKIMQNIFQSLKSKTIILIAHRLYTVSNVDEIFVFEGGKIIEHGNCHELVAMGGTYARLLSFQTVEKKEV